MFLMSQRLSMVVLVGCIVKGVVLLVPFYTFCK